MRPKYIDLARQRKASTAEYVFEVCPVWISGSGWSFTHEHFIAPALFADRRGRLTSSFLEALKSAGIVLPECHDKYWVIARVFADGTKRIVVSHGKFGASYDTRLLNGRSFSGVSGDGYGW